MTYPAAIRKQQHSIPYLCYPGSVPSAMSALEKAITMFDRQFGANSGLQLDTPFDSRQDAVMKIVFLRFRYTAPFA